MTPSGGCEQEGADLSEMPGRHTWHNKEFNAWRPCSHNGVAAWALAQTKLEYGPEETLPIIRDNDNKLVDAFDRVTDGTDAEVLTTPYQAPKANAIPLRAIPGQRTAQMPRLLPHPERAPSRQQDFGIAPVASAGFER